LDAYQSYQLLTQMMSGILRVATKDLHQHLPVVRFKIS